MPNDLQRWFDNEWWPIVIRKDARKDAIKAVDKLNPNLILRKDIVDGQIRYNLYVRKNHIEKQFIKLPATWIRGECWNDANDSGTESIQKKPIVYCKCGKIAKVGNQCPECATRTHVTYTPGLGSGQHKSLMYNHLKTFGMAKRKEETLNEWITRCRRYVETNKSRIVK